LSLTNVETNASIVLAKSLTLDVTNVKMMTTS